MNRPVISDAGPLIGMARAGCLDLLAALYEEVLVPAAVFEELRIDEDRPGATTLRAAVEAGWLRREVVRNSVQLTELQRILDRGEAEAIVLALGRAHRFLLIDERRGRQMARRRGITVVGTGGVLVVSKERGLIDAVAPMLDRLAAVGYRLSPSLRAEILRLAGE